MSPFPSPQVSQPAGNGIWEWLAIVYSTHGTISAFVTASHSCRVFHELKPAPFTLCGASGKQQHMEERKTAGTHHEKHLSCTATIHLHSPHHL